MKKIITSLIILASVLLVMCSTSYIVFKTNFFDLPTEQVETLKKLLKTDKNNELTENSVKILQAYLEKTLLSSNNPNSQTISSNYFWFIYNALPDFVDENERHNGYYKGESKQSFEDKLLSYTIYRIDRSPENLNKMFEYIKPTLKTVVTPNTYSHFQIGAEVNGLIKSYDEIIKIENYKELLTNAYTEIDTITGTIESDGETEIFRPFKNSPYGRSAHLLSKIISKHLDIQRYAPLEDSMHLSFWMRRNKEGNMESVYSILKEINELYQ